MTQEPTYSIVERDHDGFVVNIIEGLVRARAQLLADSLRMGTAYTGAHPRTCEVEREQTTQEKAEELAARWVHSGKSDHVTMRTPVALAAALDLLAEGLNSLGAQEISEVWMTVDIQVTGFGGNEHARRATVDLLAQAIGTTAEVRAHGSYSAGSGQIKVYTAIPKPPVISDETIAEAEQLSRMVRSTDLHLPQAECGCPVKGDETATYVDHCLACLEDGPSAVTS